MSLKISSTPDWSVKQIEKIKSNMNVWRQKSEDTDIVKVYLNSLAEGLPIECLVTE